MNLPSPTVGGDLPPSLRYRYKPLRDNESRDLKFSPREMQTLYLMICGKTRKQIAGLLGVSPSTIDYYRRMLFEKCEVRNATCLIRHAATSGWYKPGIQASS